MYFFSVPRLLALILYYLILGFLLIDVFSVSVILLLFMLAAFAIKNKVFALLKHYPTAFPRPKLVDYTGFVNVYIC